MFTVKFEQINLLFCSLKHAYPCNISSKCKIAVIIKKFLYDFVPAKPTLLSYLLVLRLPGEHITGQAAGHLSAKRREANESG